MRNLDPRRGEAAASAAADSILVVPAALKHLVDPVRTLLETLEAQVTRFGRHGSSVDYLSWERVLGEQVAAIERAAHQCTIAALPTGCRPSGNGL
jgi:hypothetical protein